MKELCNKWNSIDIIDLQLHVCLKFPNKTHQYEILQQPDKIISSSPLSATRFNQYFPQKLSFFKVFIICWYLNDSISLYIVLKCLRNVLPGVASVVKCNYQKVWCAITAQTYRQTKDKVIPVSLSDKAK